MYDKSVRFVKYLNEIGSDDPDYRVQVRKQHGLIPATCRPFILHTEKHPEHDHNRKKQHLARSKNYELSSRQVRKALRYTDISTKSFTNSTELNLNVSLDAPPDAKKNDKDIRCEPEAARKKMYETGCVQYFTEPDSNEWPLDNWKKSRVDFEDFFDVRSSVTTKECVRRKTLEDNRKMMMKFKRRHLNSTVFDNKTQIEQPGAKDYRICSYAGVETFYDSSQFRPCIKSYSVRAVCNPITWETVSYNCSNQCIR